MSFCTAYAMAAQARRYKTIYVMGGFEIAKYNIDYDIRAPTYGHIFLFTGINPFRRKSYISLSKQVQEEKFRNVDERFSRLTLKDQIITTVQNTVAMGGSNMKIFAAMLAVFCARQDRYGKMLLPIRTRLSNRACFNSRPLHIP